MSEQERNVVRDAFVELGYLAQDASVAWYIKRDILAVVNRLREVTERRTT